MPPMAIFKGQTFAISGKLSQTQKEYEELIRRHGGEVATSVTTPVTLLISTDGDVRACTQKVATAQGRGVPILQEGFVGACVAAKKLLAPCFFVIQGTAKKRKFDASVKAAVGRAASSEATRPNVGGRGEAGKPVTTSDTLLVIPKTGLVDKAAVVQEEMAKGFVNASLAWDVELVLNDPEKGTDKYYNMQLLAGKAGNEFWAVQHWGRTGMDGTVHIDGPFSDVHLAKRAFRKKYRAKTGNVWGQVGASFLEAPGKYKMLAKNVRSHAHGLWQYFLHNCVDGKPIGWYAYGAEAAKSMEKHWRQFESNDGLDIRIIQTDYFKYEVNFSEMIQRNTKSGMRRAIRRVDAGTKPSLAPPEKIPEIGLPDAAKPESDDDDDMHECEDGGDEEDDGDEDAEIAPSDEECEDAKAAPAVGEEAPALGGPFAVPAALSDGRREPFKRVDDMDDTVLSGRATLPAGPAGGRIAADPLAEATTDDEANAETLPLTAASRG